MSSIADVFTPLTVTWLFFFEFPVTSKALIRVYLLADRSKTPLTFQLVDNGVRISLPPQAPDPICSVVVCEVDG